MTNQNLTDLARRFHREVPERIRAYLNERGIPDESIDLNLLGWNGSRITIPIFARHRNFAFFKQAKDPDDKTDSPKMIAWPKGHLKLYGREYLTSEASQIVVCEGSSTDWCWKPMALRPSPQPLARERLKKSGKGI